VNDLQVQLPETHPRTFEANVLRAEPETTGLLELRPCTRYIQFLKIYVCAMPAHLPSFCHDVKQRHIGRRVPRNVE